MNDAHIFWLWVLAFVAAWIFGNVLGDLIQDWVLDWLRQRNKAQKGRKG